MAVIDVERRRLSVYIRWASRITGVQAGVIMALLAVIVGAFFQVRPLDAYGICIACHGRDLVNSFLNAGLRTQLPVAEASRFFPLLTNVGLLIGGFIAAISSREFRWRLPDNPLRTFIYGILVMNFALLAAGCSIRLLLRASSGEMLGVLAIVTFVIGAALATLWM